jgi:hypothetical protein
MATLKGGRVQPKTLSVKRVAAIIRNSSPDVYRRERSIKSPAEAGPFTSTKQSSHCS